MCSSDVPDYSQEMMYQSKLSAESAANELEFRKQQYADAQPRLNYLYDLAKKVGDSQSAAADESLALTREQNDFWRENYKPVEEQSIQESSEYGLDADQQQQAGRAAADTRTQQAISDASTNRGLMAMGINPNSGRFAGAKRVQQISDAATTAGASTNARTTARDKGIALRAGTVATGRGMQNVAGQSAGIATNQGSSAVGNTSTGTNAALPWASFTADGYSEVTNTANANAGLYAGLQGSANQAAAASGSSAGQVLGLIGSAAIRSW